MAAEEMGLAGDSIIAGARSTSTEADPLIAMQMQRMGSGSGMAAYYVTSYDEAIALLDRARAEAATGSSTYASR